MEGLAEEILALKGRQEAELSASPVELVEAFRRVGRSGKDLEGRLSLKVEGRKPGLLIRGIDKTDGKAMFGVFDGFTTELRESIAKPFYDEERNAVVATDGWRMLVCDIPEGLTKEDAVGAGFAADASVYPDWTRVMPSRDDTPYGLSDFKKVGEIVKGDERHKVLAALADCTRAYRHKVRKTVYSEVYTWFGSKQYNAEAVNLGVQSLFRLGCRSVRLMEALSWGGSVWSGSPLHIVGFGGGVRCRVLVMPTRFPTNEGCLVFSADTDRRKAA